MELTAHLHLVSMSIKGEVSPSHTLYDFMAMYFRTDEILFFVLNTQVFLFFVYYLISK